MLCRALAVIAGLTRHRRIATRILRISRVVSDLDRAEAFYRDRLGFVCLGREAGDPALARLLGIETAMRQSVLQLGDQQIALVQFDRHGAPYPADSRSNDLWFQHLAIVVGDMLAAYRQLLGGPVQPISADGPQTLPPRNGAVIAFKFRDPDGHPLELIHFPPGQGRAMWHAPGKALHRGIDHSALAVSRTGRSVRFYRKLGFRIADRSYNHGPAQSRLDDLPNACVRVTGLRPGHTHGPGLELLGYQPPGRPTPPHDAAAHLTDWVTLSYPGLCDGIALSDGTRASLVRDPDGHLVLLVGRP